MCKISWPSYVDIYERKFALEKPAEIGQENRSVPSDK